MPLVEMRLSRLSGVGFSEFRVFWIKSINVVAGNV